MESNPAATDASQTTGLKRKRVDNSEDTVPPSFTPEYSDMCFDDGTIILQCLPSSIAFRVHRGVLAVHSEIFRDIFALAQPDPHSDSTLPNVCVHDDADKLYQLLKYIYLRQFPGIKEKHYMDTVLNIFDLAIKYNVKLARADCENSLRIAFPDSLSNYHKAVEEVLINRINVSQCLRSIDLFTRHEYWTLIPSVFASLLLTQSPPGSFDRLMPDYTSACTMAIMYKGKSGLQRLSLETVHKFVRDIINEPASLHCGHKLARIFVDHIYREGTSDGAAYMFQKNVPLAADIASGAIQFCAVCREQWRSAEIAGRERAWSKMPTFFELGTWDELREKEAQAHPPDSKPVETGV